MLCWSRKFCFASFFVVIGCVLFVQFGVDALPAEIEIPEDSYRDSMFWGSYRPGTYFGMKTRTKIPIMTGLMWSPAYKFQSLRHNCRHEDNLKKYGWVMHNGKDFGKHEMIDPLINAKISAQFVKRSPEDEFGGSWANRIRAQRLEKTSNQDGLSTFFYVIFPEACTFQKIATKKKGIPHVKITGKCPEVEDFTLWIEQEGSEAPQSETQKASQLKNFQFLGVHVPDSESWNIQEKVEQALVFSYQNEITKFTKRKGDNTPKKAPQVIATLPNTIEKESNVFIFQKLSQLPMTMDIVFLQHQSVAGTTELSTNHFNVYKDQLVANSLTEILKERAEDFEIEFDKKFHLREAQGFDNRVEPIAKSALSNMIGGMGYWHGESLIFEGKGQEATVKPAQSLFSAVPSRPFFPRAFLWDEGFHQLLISEWDQSLTIDIVRHWFNLMDETGWIPREQILGEEARSRVPYEFQPQHRDHANPPAFLLCFDKLVRKFNKKLQKEEKQSLIFSDDSSVHSSSEKQKILIESNPELVQLYSFFKDLYPRLSYWYSWFLRSQAGSQEFTFRWRGRTKDHTLSSGLDDFPRSVNPSLNELHVDLSSWLAFMGRVVGEVAEIVDENPSTFNRYSEGITKSLELFWDEDREIYSDIVNVTSTGAFVYSQHVGYVNLFPLMLGLVPNDSPKFLSMLKYIEDPNHLWSGHGIRSLSKSDPFYRQGENYWRGPVWINMNYLLLSSLKRNYFSGPHEKDARRVYDLLRSGLVDNMVDEFQRTGFLWEQYHEETGRGSRSHPFTGWSALVLAIISELY